MLRVTNGEERVTQWTRKVLEYKTKTNEQIYS